MKHPFWLLTALTFTWFLSSCANRDGEGNPLETGPFDSAGNYREDWVADPSKWSKPGSKPSGGGDELPLVAENDVPPPDSSPLAPVVEQSPKPKVQTAGGKSTGRKVQSGVKTGSRVVSSSGRATNQRKASAVKLKAKNRSYVVQKGDSLDRIARKTGTTVAALQKANGIRGTMIHPGKALVVPPSKR